MIVAVVAKELSRGNKVGCVNKPRVEIDRARRHCHCSPRRAIGGILNIATGMRTNDIICTGVDFGRWHIVWLIDVLLSIHEVKLCP